MFVELTAVKMIKVTLPNTFFKTSLHVLEGVFDILSTSLAAAPVPGTSDRVPYASYHVRNHQLQRWNPGLPSVI